MRLNFYVILIAALFTDFASMELTLILGPMKSGKSFDLISYVAPLRFTERPFALYQSNRNVRDAQVWSRNGVNLDAVKTTSLKDAIGKGFGTVAVDEVHMFSESIAEEINQLLQEGTRVIVSGLDTDYRGRMFPVIQRLLELGPKEVRYRRAVCEGCRAHDAIYTQVFRNAAPVVAGLPSVIPDDGTCTYAPVCRNCFVSQL